MSANAIETLREAPDSPFGPGDAARYYDALAAVEALLEAANEWWLAKRPIDWTEAQHAAQPFVNCVGLQEQELAAAVRRVETGQ